MEPLEDVTTVVAQDQRDVHPCTFSLLTRLLNLQLSSSLSASLFDCSNAVKANRFLVRAAGSSTSTST